MVSVTAAKGVEYCLKHRVCGKRNDKLEGLSGGMEDAMRSHAFGPLHN